MDIHVVSDQSSQESVQHTCTSLYKDDVKLPYVIGEVEVKNSEQSSTGNMIMSQRLDKWFRLQILQSAKFMYHGMTFYFKC